MLQIAKTGVSGSRETRSEQSFLPQLDLLSLARIAYKHWPTIVAGVVVASVLGVVYIATAPRMYTATTQILVDPNSTSIMSKQDAAPSREIDPGLIDSQVQVLKSDSVALTAVRNLDLLADESFLHPPRGLLSSIKAMIPMPSFGATPAPPTPDDLRNDAAQILVDATKVTRVGQSYVMEVSYTGRDPVDAARIANGLADAYAVSDLEARYESTRRAEMWIQDRIKDLRDQASAADLAVQKFKSDNGIVDTSRGLMSEQQLADVNSQLIAAHAATVEAKTKLDRVVEVSKGDIVNATVADALRSEIITRLRAQYLDIAAKRSELAGKYGAEHGAVKALQNQMDEINRAAREELNRLAEGSRSDYQIAQARENTLRQSMDTLVAQRGVSNKAEVALRNLESSAQTFRSLYDSFLQKLEETHHVQNFPVSNARVITPATAPQKPSSPKVLLILAGSCMLGMVLGFGGALLRELFGNVFRTPDDVRDYAGIECLGTLPRLDKEVKASRNIKRSHIDPNVLGGATPLSRHAVHTPFSRFSETIRNIKVSMDLARGATGCAITGVVSSVPSEGKTTVSANLAQLTSQMGHRTLLIDGDMHNPSSTRTLAPDAKVGLLDILDGTHTLSEAIKRDSITGLDFLPTVVKVRRSNTATLMTSPAMVDLLNEARAHYDYVIVDLPPLVPVVDVKAAAHLFDQFVFVVEWGRTSRDVVRDAMISAEQVRHRIVGAVLSKADPSELKRSEAYRGASYGSYYTDSDAA